MGVMMDRDILGRIDNEELVITPFDPETQLQPASVDLTLGSEFKVFPDELEIIDTHEQISMIPREPDKDGSLIIQPGEFILATTQEQITMPDNCLGMIEGRSSLGRIGLAIHVTAGFVDPGFKGQLTLELKNLSNKPIKIYPGQRVCQMVIVGIWRPVETPYGSDQLGSKYQNQEGPVESRIDEDQS